MRNPSPFVPAKTQTPRRHERVYVRLRPTMAPAQNDITGPHC